MSGFVHDKDLFFYNIVNFLYFYIIFQIFSPILCSPTIIEIFFLSFKYYLSASHLSKWILKWVSGGYTVIFYISAFSAVNAAFPHLHFWDMTTECKDIIRLSQGVVRCRFFFLRKIIFLWTSKPKLGLGLFKAFARKYW